MKTYNSKRLQTYSIEHQDDYEGDIVVKHSYSGQEMTIPVCVLEEFFAEKIRHDKIEQLKKATQKDLLALYM